MTKSTLDKILDAAIIEFAQHGYAGATVEQIARTAGVNKAALYYHVGNKEALYERVLSHKLSTAADTIEGSLDQARDGRDALIRLVDGLAQHFTLRPLMPRIMVQELARGGDNLSPLILAQMARLIACSKRVSAMAAEESSVSIAPLALHISLLAPLAFHALSSHARERAAALPIAQSLDLDLSMDTLAELLKQSLTALLFPESESNPASSGDPRSAP